MHGSMYVVILFVQFINYFVIHILHVIIHVNVYSQKHFADLASNFARFNLL